MLVRRICSIITVNKAVKGQNNESLRTKVQLLVLLWPASLRNMVEVLELL